MNRRLSFSGWEGTNRNKENSMSMSINEIRSSSPSRSVK